MSQLVRHSHFKQQTLVNAVVISVVLALLCPSLLKAEPPVNPQMPQQQQQPQPQQPQQNANRDSGAGNAAAMAAMGAAMAGMSCMMMMKMAQEEQDPKQKQMMQMMAMQQCAQAAQSAANAGQNKDAQKGAQDAQPAQQPTFQTPTMAEQPKDDKEDKNLLATNKTEPEPEEKKDDTPIKVDPLKVPEQAKKDDGEKPLTGGAPAIEIPTSTPKQIDKAMITANENAKEGGPSTDPDSKVMGLGGFSGGRIGTTSDDLKKAAEGELTADGKPLKRARGNAEPEMGGGGDGGGGGSSEKSAGGDPFDQMLSQLLGGPPGGVPGMEMGFGGGTFEVTSLPKSKDPKKSMNIFQFASTWYGKLSHTDGRLRVRPNASKLNPSTTATDRSISSVTNSVVKASVP